MGTAAQALGVALSLLMTIAPARSVNSGETLEELQRRFDNEADGVNKAKMLQKLGDAQFVREREAVKASDFSTAGLIMEKYRDNVRAALEAVIKAHPDGERHPNGYKQLQMHIEGGLRETDRERQGLPLTVASGDGRHQARIDAAAQERPEGHVTA